MQRRSAENQSSSSPTKHLRQSAPPDPLAVIRLAASRGVREVAVGVSCGLDSVATLDLCHRHFSRVAAYFMYIVPGLSFQEQYLGYLERRYKPLEIIRLPHWMLSGWFRSNLFRHPTKQANKTPRVRIGDVEAFVRRKTGVEWFATGEKTSDSLERNAQIRPCGGINEQRRRVWPIAFWSQRDVAAYCERRGILRAPDYRVMPDGRSFGSLWVEQIAAIKRHFPDDYAKIREVFPLVDAQILRAEFLAQSKHANESRRDARKK